MKATWKDEHFPHVLLEDFFTKEELKYALHEANRIRPTLLPPHKTGTATRGAEQRPTKQNSGMFLPYDSPIPELASRHLSEELVGPLDNWFSTVWRRNNFRCWLLSRYSNGEYYNAHTDAAQWTVLLWIFKEPKPFKGGDLIFTDYDYTIECKNNSGIIFPGPIKHEVPPIEGDGRYTITLFTGLEQPKQQ